MGIWSDMNHDLLVLIAKRISSSKDFVVFGCVCQTWRSAATRDNFNYWLPNAPWLMLPEKSVDHDEREFYSLPDDKIYKIALPPEVSGKRCFSSSQGWIFTVETGREVHLVHPLSRSVIQLPDLSTFPMFDDEFPDWGEEGFDVEYIQRCFIEKVALSLSLSLSPNITNPLTSSSSKSKYVVMVICGEKLRLCFHREGDEGWTLVDIPGSAFFDVVYTMASFMVWILWEEYLPVMLMLLPLQPSTSVPCPTTHPTSRSYTW